MLTYSYNPSSYIIGILFFATDRHNSNLVFHYPQSVNLADSDSVGNNLITEIASDTKSNNNHGNINKSDYILDSVDTSTRGNETGTSNSIQRSHGDSSNDTLKSIKEHSIEPSNETTTRKDSITERYFQGEDLDEDFFLDESSDSSDNELNDGTFFSEEFDATTDKKDQFQDMDYDVDNEYDSNNPSLQFEVFNNSYFIESILEDDFNITKLKYAVSHECTEQLRALKEIDQSFGRIKIEQLPNLSLLNQTNSYEYLESEKLNLYEHLKSRTKYLEKLLNHKVLGFNKESLESLLDPQKFMMNEKFEVKVNQLTILSCPVSPDYKRQANPSKHVSNNNDNNEEENNTVNNENDIEASVTISNLLANIDLLKFFNIGFVINPLLLDYKYNSVHDPNDINHRPNKKEQIYNNVLQKLTYLLLKEQLKYNYVSNQLKLISELKEQFFKRFYLSKKGVKYRAKVRDLHSKKSTDFTHSDFEEDPFDHNDEADDCYVNKEFIDDYFTLENYYNYLISNSSLLKLLFDCYSSLSSPSSISDKNMVSGDSLATNNKTFDLVSKNFELKINKNYHYFTIPVKHHFSTLPESSSKLLNQNHSYQLNKFYHYINNSILRQGNSRVNRINKDSNFSIIPKLVPTPNGRYSNKTLFIDTLSDEYFYKAGLFPSFSNMTQFSSSSNNSSISDKKQKILDINNTKAIINSFKHCGFEKFAVLKLANEFRLNRNESLIINRYLDGGIQKDKEIVNTYKLLVRKMDPCTKLGDIIKEIISKRNKSQFSANSDALTETTDTSVDDSNYKGVHENRHTSIHNNHDINRNDHHHNDSNDNKILDGKNEKRIFTKVIADKKDSRENEKLKDDIIRILYYLIYTEKIKLIIPIKKTTKFVISPLANIGTNISDLNDAFDDYDNISDPDKFFSQLRNYKPDHRAIDSKFFGGWLKNLDFELFEDFKLSFPSLPNLTEFLSYFNSPRRYTNFSKNKNKQKTYLEACIWILKKGLIVQWYSFAWVLIPYSIKLQVEQEFASSNSSSFTNVKHVGSSMLLHHSKNSFSSTGSSGGISNIEKLHRSESIRNQISNFMVHENGNNGGSFTNIARRGSSLIQPSSLRNESTGNNAGANHGFNNGVKDSENGDGSSLNNNGNNNGVHRRHGLSNSNISSSFSDMREEDIILINPDKPNFLEKRYISKILANQTKESKDIFYKILKYLNGKVPLELAMLKEGVKSVEMERTLDAMKDYIIIDHHW